MTYAIEPKSRADEDKLAPAIHKLMEEDPHGLAAVKLDANGGEIS